jgi:hypothetical protein
LSVCASLQIIKTFYSLKVVPIVLLILLLTIRQNVRKLRQNVRKLYENERKLYENERKLRKKSFMTRDKEKKKMKRHFKEKFVAIN